MPFTHNTYIFTLETPKGKTNLTWSFITLFISFIVLFQPFKIQYKVFSNLRNPNSQTGIRLEWAKKPWAEKSPKTKKKKKKKKFLGDHPPPDPPLIWDPTKNITHIQHHHHIYYVLRWSFHHIFLYLLL